MRAIGGLFMHTHMHTGMCTHMHTCKYSTGHFANSLYRLT